MLQIIFYMIYLIQCYKLANNFLMWGKKYEKKIIGIFVMMLLIATVIPSSGGINIVNYLNQSTKSLSVEWNMTYGREHYDRLYCVHETDDGGYISCGQTRFGDGMETTYRPWVLKVNSIGDVEWEWILTEIDDYAGYYFQFFRDTRCSLIKQTNDGGYLLCFYFKDEVPIGGDEWYPYFIAGLVKLDRYGSEVWYRYFIEELEWVFIPSSFIEIDDGGFILAGYACDPDPISTDYEAGIMKIDEDGNEQWYKGYNYGDNIDVAWAICSTNDEGYVLTGYVDGETSKDYWMIKTDSSGNIIWNCTFGGDKDDFGHPRNCFQTNDNGFIMCGYSYSFGLGKCDLWIVKTDTNGNMIWNKTYGYSDKDVCWSMEETNDGFVYCVTEGYDRNTGNKADIHLVKTDDNGNIIWIQEFGGEGCQIGQYIDKTSDGGYIVSGRTDKHRNPNSDGLLVKFAPFENQRPNIPTTPDGTTDGKPNEEFTFLTSSNDPDGDTLSYLWDWGDGNFTEGTFEESHIWTTENTFEIKVMAKDEHGGESDWSDPFIFSTPKNKEISTSFFLNRLIHRFPFFEKILNQIF
jgi:hypothetical protein